MIKRIWGLTTVILLGAVLSTAYAFLSTDEKEILKGVDRVRIEVARFKPEIERDGLFRSTLQKDMELKLQLAGMKILSEDEAPNSSNCLCLYLDIDALKCSIGYVYRVQVILKEMVTLARKPVKSIGTTYSTPDHFSISQSLSEIRENARDVVDEFIKEWMEANLK
jgi:hypothetical protein